MGLPNRELGRATEREVGPPANVRFAEACLERLVNSKNESRHRYAEISAFLVLLTRFVSGTDRRSAKEWVEGRLSMPLPEIGEKRADEVETLGDAALALGSVGEHDVAKKLIDRLALFEGLFEANATLRLANSMLENGDKRGAAWIRELAERAIQSDTAKRLMTITGPDEWKRATLLDPDILPIVRRFVGKSDYMNHARIAELAAIARWENPEKAARSIEEWNVEPEEQSELLAVVAEAQCLRNESCAETIERARSLIADQYTYEAEAAAVALLRVAYQTGKRHDALTETAMELFRYEIESDDDSRGIELIHAAEVAAEFGDETTLQRLLELLDGKSMSIRMALSGAIDAAVRADRPSSKQMALALGLFSQLSRLETAAKKKVDEISSAALSIASAYIRLGRHADAERYIELMNDADSPFSEFFLIRAALAGEFIRQQSETT